MIDPDTLTPDERTRLLRALRALPPATPLHRIRWDTVLMALRSGGEPVDPISGTVGELLDHIDTAEARRAAESAREVDAMRTRFFERLKLMASRIDPDGSWRKQIAALPARERARRRIELEATIRRHLDEAEARRKELHHVPAR